MKRYFNDSCAAKNGYLLERVFLFSFRKIRHTKLWFITAAVLTVSKVTYSETISTLPEVMTFSYVNHPTMINRLIPITEKAYEKLGVKAEFVPQPSYRNLRLVETGLVDGDVGYMKIVLSTYNNLLAIEPPVVSGIFVLLCQPKLPCDESILFDADQTVVTTSATLEGAQKGYDKSFLMTPYILNNIGLIVDFIAMERFEYALYATSKNEIWRLQNDAIKYVELFDASVYHIINEKYSGFQSIISNAILEAQKEFDATQ